MTGASEQLELINNAVRKRLSVSRTLRREEVQRGQLNSDFEGRRSMYFSAPLLRPHLRITSWCLSGLSVSLLG